MIRLLVIFFTLTLTGEIWGQMAHGIVFLDATANGIFDKNEKGIPNVAVSNGRDVVLTDQKGKYTINAPDNSYIFVVKPADFRFPMNEVNLPQFYYGHFPNGSALNPGIVRPTGPLPSEINFPLLPSESKSNFDILIMGDTQVRNLEEIDFLSRDIVAELCGSNRFEFGSILGDLVFDALEIYEPLNSVMAALEMPVFNVPGNHDQNYNAMSDQLANETYQHIYGPKNYSYNYGEVHFIGLDNIIYSGDTVKRGYEEGFDDAVLEFIKNDLRVVAPEKLIVLMMHAPFINSDSREPVRNLEKLLAILSPFPHTFSISGHDHSVSQQLITGKYGWQGETPHHHFNTGAACGNWWLGNFDDTGIPEATMYDGSPNGYSIVRFTGNTYVVDYKVARKPADFQMKVYSPVSIPKNIKQETVPEVVVNFFTGSEDDLVEIRFDEGSWNKMTYTVMSDPAYARQRKLWENPEMKMDGKMPARPINSRHIWKIPVPSNLIAGMHRVDVVATDLFGRQHKAFHFFRVEE